MLANIKMSTNLFLYMEVINNQVCMQGANNTLQSEDVVRNSVPFTDEEKSLDSPTIPAGGSASFPRLLANERSDPALLTGVVLGPEPITMLNNDSVSCNEENQSQCSSEENAAGTITYPPPRNPSLNPHASPWTPMGGGSPTAFTNPSTKPTAWRAARNKNGKLISTCRFSSMMNIDDELAGFSSLEFVLEALSNFIPFEDTRLFLAPGVNFSSNYKAKKPFAWEFYDDNSCPGLKIFGLFDFPDRPIQPNEYWLSRHIPHTTAEFFKYGPFRGVRSARGEYKIAIKQKEWQTFPGTIKPTSSLLQTLQLPGGWVFAYHSNSKTFNKSHHLTHIVESQKADRALQERYRQAPLHHIKNHWRDYLDEIVYSSPFAQTGGSLIVTTEKDPTIEAFYDATLSKDFMQTAVTSTTIRAMTSASLINDLCRAGLVSTASYGYQMELAIAYSTTFQTCFQNMSYYQKFTISNWLALTTPRKYPIAWRRLLVFLFLTLLLFSSVLAYYENHTTFSVWCVGVSLAIVSYLYHIHRTSVQILAKAKPPWLTQPRAYCFSPGFDVPPYLHFGKFFAPDGHLLPSAGIINYLTDQYKNEAYIRGSSVSHVFWSLKGFHNCFIQPADCPQAIISAIKRYMKPPLARPYVDAVGRMGAAFREYIRGDRRHWAAETPPVLTWTEELLTEYLQKHPDKKISYLRSWWEFIHYKLIPGSINAMVKLDETLLGNPEEPEFLSKARIIINPGPLYASLTSPVATMLTDRLKELLRARAADSIGYQVPFLNKSVPFEFIWASGCTPSELNLYLQRMLHSVEDKVWIWAAGDDSLIAIMDQGNWRFIEGDFSGYDSSQTFIKERLGETWGTLVESLHLARELGMDSNTEKLLVKIITSSINFRFRTGHNDFQTFNLRNKMDEDTEATYYPLPTGIAVTTLFNTSVTMSAWFHVLTSITTLDETSLRSCFETLGFNLKICKFHDVVSAVTFLKMTPCCVTRSSLSAPYSVGEFVWVPILGVVLKAGLAKKDPRHFYPHLTEEEILIRYPHDISAGFLSYPSTIFTRPLVKKFYQKSFTNETPIRAWGTHSISGFENADIFNHVLVEESWDLRYSTPTTPVSFEGFENYISEVLTINCNVKHNMFDIILHTDYS